MDASNWVSLRVYPRLAASTELVCWQLFELGADAVNTDHPEYLLTSFTAEKYDRVRFELEKLPAKIETDNLSAYNWQQNWREHFPDFSLNQFSFSFIATTEEALADPPAGLIQIIPGMGFGSGHHPTTRMLIEAISSESPAVFSQSESINILDLGSGSGILAVVLAKLFETKKIRIIAVDNDAQAIINARDNFRINGVREQIEVVQGTLETLCEQSPELRFDFVVANIYLSILSEIALKVLSVLNAEHSLLLLSGIRLDQRSELTSVYQQAAKARKLSLSTPEQVVVEDWVMLKYRT